jgi:1-acyl-sn-glycerol-3-phosphate acyltransferase
MRHPYMKPVSAARAEVRLKTPELCPQAMALLRILAWPYLALVLGYRSVDIQGARSLAEAFHAHLSGRTRVILAFRHPYGDEPQLMGWLFLCRIAREARRLGVHLPYAPHALFVHGYEVPRWGGPLLRWLLPRVGAMPVHHARIDSEGMARIREAIVNGRYPLALAPEGQVSYASERLPRLEQGTVRLGMAAADELVRAGRSEPVHVIPVSIHHRYGPEALPSLERLVSRILAFAGLQMSPGSTLRERLGSGVDRILALAEEQYDLGGGQSSESSQERGLELGQSSSRDERLSRVISRALDAGERILGLNSGTGDPIERVYRIRQAGWDRVFLEGTEPRKLPPLERALADRRAGEAWYAMRHMELVDFCWYFRCEPPDESAPLHRMVEYAQNLWDFGSRLAGGAISERIMVRPKKAVVVVGEALDLSARLPEWRENRKSTVAGITAALGAAYLACIEETGHV